MRIVHADTIVNLAPGAVPNYRRANPTLKLMQAVARTQLAGTRDIYAADSLQYLLPFDALSLYPPSNGSAVGPEEQDDKSDFQKQNIASFTLADTRVVRGLCVTPNWVGPFLRVSYRGGPDSALSRARNQPLGESIRLTLAVRGGSSGQTLRVPYNDRTDDYEIELWGCAADTLAASDLDGRCQAALARGELVCRPDIVQGNAEDFAREALDGKDSRDVRPDSTLHPVLPLGLTLAWSSDDGAAVDDRGGLGYHYEFAMLLRGWNAYLAVGASPQTHGGFGVLEYRNLLSNYGPFAGSGELGRMIANWSFDAFGNKASAERHEPFFAVDYMDLHLMRPNSAIGLHRHRDNQEVFVVLSGKGLMVVGDWAELPSRQRAFEVRSLMAGHLVLLKGGNLHALVNPADEELGLLMFGGYD
jgi:hypothetical protein